jgi:hypothetical protein
MNYHDDDTDDTEELIGVLIDMVRFTIPSFIPLSFELATHKTDDDLFRVVLIGAVDGKPHRYTATGKSDDNGKLTLIGELVS